MYYSLYYIGFFFVALQINRGLNSELISGYHYWRKSDTYAQILNYYNNGLNFFDFSLYFNQMTSQGKAVGEFPLFYYLIAIQKTIFGDHIIVAKINWIIVSFFGLFSLFKIALHFTKSHIYSFIIALSPFLLPIYSVYLVEFLPDPIAFHFVLIGLYFLLRSHNENKKHLLYFSLFFISWAGMIKPFFLIPYIAFLCIYLFIRIKEKKINYKDGIYFIPALFILVWFYYMTWYNRSVDCDCFLSTLQPLWKIAPEEIATLKLYFINIWLPGYISAAFGIVCLLVTLLYFILKPKEKPLTLAFVSLSILGTLIFTILFFVMIKNHDYYVWPVLFLMPLILTAFIQMFSEKKWWNTIIPSIIGIGLLTTMYFHTSYASNIRRFRINDPFITPSWHFSTYTNLDHFLNKNGITKDTLIIAFSDKSPNYALSLMNRKGWSGYQTEYVKYTIPMLKNLGANYLILNDQTLNHQDSILLTDVSMKLIADTNHLFLYHLLD